MRHSGFCVVGLLLLSVSGFAASSDTPLSMDAVWKYWDKGTFPGESWQAPEFEDSAWPSGPGPLGYGGDGEKTVINYGTNAKHKHAAYYFRTHVKIENPDDPRKLLALMQFDDGAVVYFNNHELLRDNMPTGTINESTLSNYDIYDENMWHPFALPRDLIRKGDNTLAVEVHQVGRGSSDVRFKIQVMYTNPVAAIPECGRGFSVPLPGGKAMEFVWVPSGVTQIGCHETDPYLTWAPQVGYDGFWLGKYEVTQEQWESLMTNNPSLFKGASNPVENVAWDECVRFCDRFNAMTAPLTRSGGPPNAAVLNDYKFRLPREFEWEFAAASMLTLSDHRPRFYLGEKEDSLARVAWYMKNSGGTTHPVGQKEPTPWGLYDMPGNVWEWCDDQQSNRDHRRHRDDGARGITRPTRAPFHAVRGGSWFNTGLACRSTFMGKSPAVSGGSIGFRVGLFLEK